MPLIPLSRVVTRGSYRESLRIGAILRKETTGGVLLMLAALIAIIWANSPEAGTYVALRDTVVGPAALHLDLTLGTWAADGLLAVFFFLVGLELKQEFVAGDLRDPGVSADRRSELRDRHRCQRSRQGRHSGGVPARLGVGGSAPGAQRPSVPRAGAHRAGGRRSSGRRAAGLSDLALLVTPTHEQIAHRLPGAISS